MFEFEIGTRDIAAIRRVFERDGMEAAMAELSHRVPTLFARLTAEGLTPREIVSKFRFFAGALVARGRRGA